MVDERGGSDEDPGPPAVATLGPFPKDVDWVEQCDVAPEVAGPSEPSESSTDIRIDRRLSSTVLLVSERKLFLRAG